jgi:SP family general alpha glucoside:H+ symporter-like MFS transporter
MASKFDNVEINEHVPEMANTRETSQLGHLANQEDHEVGKLASFANIRGLVRGAS